MKELKIRDKDGQDIGIFMVNVEGDDFAVEFPIPLLVALKSITLESKEKDKEKKMPDYLRRGKS